MSPAGREAPGTVTVRPRPEGRRRADLRFVGLFVVFGIPVAAVLWAIVGPVVAAVYLVGQTAFLTYGLRRRHTPTLRLDAEGLSWEPGRFQLRCGWDDVEGVGEADLPSGRVEVLTLRRGSLHWAADAGVRDEVRRKGWDRVVPVGELDPAWRDGPVGDAARRWAPRLLA